MSHSIISHIKYFLLFSIFFSGSILVFGQSSQLKNYSVKDGLPSSEIYSSMQDSKGYMWFATDKGVSRFDGYSFFNLSTANGLPDNTIFECLEDYKGRIWFRSFSGKLSYFYNDSIYKLPINDSLSKLVRLSSVISFAVDSNDNILMGLHSFKEGLIEVNLKENKLDIIKIPPWQGYWVLVGNKIVYGCTTPSIYDPQIIPKHIPSITLYKATKEGSLRKIKTFISPIDYGGKIHDLVFPISNKNIIVSLSNKLYNLDTTSGIFNLITDFKTDEFISLKSFKNNTFWMSSRKVLKYFDGTRLTSENTPSFITKKQVTSITEDKEGGIWFTTLYGGVYYANSLAFVNYTSENGLSGDKVTTFDIATDGSIWAGIEGNNIINIIKDSIKHITERKIPITSIKTDHLNRFWVGYSDGLTIFRENSSKIASIDKNRGEGISNFIFNTNETCWVNEYSRLGLVCKTNNSFYEKPIAQLNSKIFAIEKDTDASIWIGTLKGLFHYYKDSLYNIGDRFSILKNRINDLKIMPGNDDIWIATRDTGILVKHGNSISRITIADGLLSNFCQCLCIDHLGNIWAGSNKGISHILTNKNTPNHPVDTIINITTSSLLEVNTIKTRGDTVYAGTSNGLTLFDMNKVSSNKVPPMVHITGIKVNNQNKYISSAYNLKYDENYLIINFVGLTYKDAGNTQYRYKMEGIDTGWIYTKNRDVPYPKLPPGNYTFLVSAMNNDGVWNQHPASVKFYISPPFWATWWARSLFILAIASFIYWRFTIVTNRAKKEAEINKHLISMELKELKAQMDPHFLFNNLNTLTQLVEIKSDDAPEFVEELSRYYRYSLQFRNTEFTTLDNELKQAERYLHILKIRFGDNIHVTWNVNDVFKNYYIATYSMQLLLENITKHNIVSASKPIWVNINTNTNGYLEVKNQYQPKNSSALSNKHGLKSIDQRYQLLISKNINITQNSEVFSVQLPLISPTQYESIYS